VQHRTQRASRMVGVTKEINGHLRLAQALVPRLPYPSVSAPPTIQFVTPPTNGATKTHPGHPTRNSVHLAVVPAQCRLQPRHRQYLQAVHARALTLPATRRTSGATNLQLRTTMERNVAASAQRQLLLLHLQEGGLLQLQLQPVEAKGPRLQLLPIVAIPNKSPRQKPRRYWTSTTSSVARLASLLWSGMGHFSARLRRRRNRSAHFRTRRPTSCRFQQARTWQAAPA